MYVNPYACFFKSSTSKFCDNVYVVLSSANIYLFIQHLYSTLTTNKYALMRCA